MSCIIICAIKNDIYCTEKNDTLNEWADWVEIWHRHAPRGQDKRGDGNLDIVDQEPRYWALHSSFGNADAS